MKENPNPVSYTHLHHFHATGNGVSFEVEGTQDVQIILGLEEDAQYKVYISDTNTCLLYTSTIFLRQPMRILQMPAQRLRI